MSKNQNLPQKKGPTRGRKTRIVLVEDHPLVRERLADIINRESSMEVCGEAESRDQAVSVIMAKRPDLAIVDLSLKNSSGLSLIGDIRTSLPKLKVLVLTMNESAGYARRALGAGASGYMTKRDATARILTAVKEVLAGRLYVSPDLAGSVLSQVMRGKQGGVENLSDRELEVLDLLGLGQNTTDISETLHIDSRTVETYRARIKVKLNLRSGTELLRFAIEWRNAQNGMGI